MALGDELYGGNSGSGSGFGEDLYGQPKEIASDAGSWKEAIRRSLLETPIVGPLVRGAADVGVGAAQLLGNVVGLGDEVNPLVAEREREYQAIRKARGGEGFDVGRMIGGVAATLPAAIAAPVFRGAQGMRAGAAQVAKNVGTQAAVGGGLAALSPVTEGDYFSEKVNQIGAGAALGGLAGGVLTPAVQATGRLAGLAKDALQGRLGQLRAAEVARAAAGGDDAAIRAALAGADDRLLAGQAAADIPNAEWQALAAKAEAHGGTPYSNVRGAQEAARRNLLQSVTPDEEAAIAARSATTGPMYEAATAPGTMADTRAVISEIDSLMRRQGSNPELATALTSLRNSLVGPRGKPYANAERVASAMDGLKAQIAKKENRYIQGQLVNLRDELASTIPGYQAAQRKFSEMSVPVNQSQVLKEMGSVLAKPGGGERVTPFLNAMGRGEQAMLKRSTGFPRYSELDEVLSPDQMTAVNRIAGELNRDLGSEQLAKAGSGRLADLIEKTNRGAGLPPIFNPVVTATRYVLGKSEEAARAQLVEELSKGMVSPKAALELLNQLPAYQQSRLLRELAINAPRYTPYVTSVAAQNQ